ncbi:MAG: chlorite dismutase family protein [Verrucomicrobiales bacterium]|nr:chlorite dismutase family protein [Verrucomicrobiales bacterium]
MNPNPRLFSFAGGREGLWRLMGSRAVIGEGLPAVEAVSVSAGSVLPGNDEKKWVLRGVTSNDRYVTRSEKQQLQASQPALGRPEADCAVLIPIRKNAAWWALTQDERREIFEAKSHHTQIGLDALPAIARRLHHCRDLSEAEPFDFITWFEFAAKDVAVFDQTLERLRISEEWSYVDREVEIRLKRDL